MSSPSHPALNCFANHASITLAPTSSLRSLPSFILIRSTIFTCKCMCIWLNVFAVRLAEGSTLVLTGLETWGRASHWVGRSFKTWMSLLTHLCSLRILHDRRPALASMVRSTCSHRLLPLSSARWCPGMGASWLWSLLPSSVFMV